MKISFHGAAQTVTGSKHKITLENGKSFLLDCGMFQGLGKNTPELNRHFGFDPRTIDFVLLSHAHIDHSGLLPSLVKEGFEGKIYCTQATYELCKIMLADSAYIQQSDIIFYNKKRKKQGRDLLKPIYNINDVVECLNHFVPVPYNEEVKVDDFVHVTFTNNGHILGSATVNIRLTDGNQRRNICYTGDVGRFDTILLQDPEPFPQPDILICESTYGNRLHSNIIDAEKELLDAVIETCKNKKGKLIIPSFSLGRTQEIVFTLNKLDLRGLLPDVKIYVDSPLSVNATNITKKFSNLLNKKVKELMKKRSNPFGFEDLIYINNKKDSQLLNFSKEPCIIISASGMAEAGRVKHHIMHNITKPENTILIVGYAEPLSLAGRLRNGDNEVKIFGDDYKVNADIKVIDSYSAHGDYNEIIKYLNFIDAGKIEKVFLVHGDKDAQDAFKDTLKDNGFNNIFIPAIHSEYFA